jgi:hypothetical protein
MSKCLFTRIVSQVIQAAVASENKASGSRTNRIQCGLPSLPSECDEAASSSTAVYAVSLFHSCFVITNMVLPDCVQSCLNRTPVRRVETTPAGLWLRTFQSRSLLFLLVRHLCSGSAELAECVRWPRLTTYAHGRDSDSFLPL